MVDRGVSCCCFVIAAFVTLSVSVRVVHMNLVLVVLFCVLYLLLILFRV